MASLNYDNIFSRFYTKVEAFDFLYEDISDEMMGEFQLSWLRSSVAYPYIRRLFSSISFDDENCEVNYKMNYSIDDFSDEEFVTDVLAYGMIYCWLEPKVRSITNIIQTFTSSEQKFYSQSNHLSELRALLSDAELKIRSLIRDRGYIYNAYLDGGV